MKATWNDQVIAESEETIVVEGNHYFPPDAIDRSFLASSETQSTCPWKGTASYYSIVVDDKINKDAAWYYPAPKDAASHIKDYVAFWKGIEVSE